MLITREKWEDQGYNKREIYEEKKGKKKEDSSLRVTRQLFSIKILERKQQEKTVISARHLRKQ